MGSICNQFSTTTRGIGPSLSEWGFLTAYRFCRAYMKYLAVLQRQRTRLLLIYPSPRSPIVTHRPGIPFSYWPVQRPGLFEALGTPPRLGFIGGICGRIG